MQNLCLRQSHFFLFVLLPVRVAMVRTSVKDLVIFPCFLIDILCSSILYWHILSISSSLWCKVCIHFHSLTCSIQCSEECLLKRGFFPHFSFLVLQLNFTRLYIFRYLDIVVFSTQVCLISDSCLFTTMLSRCAIPLSYPVTGNSLLTEDYFLKWS